MSLWKINITGDHIYRLIIIIIDKTRRMIDLISWRVGEKHPSLDLICQSETVTVATSKATPFPRPSAPSLLNTCTADGRGSTDHCLNKGEVTGAWSCSSSTIRAKINVLSCTSIHSHNLISC